MENMRLSELFDWAWKTQRDLFKQSDECCSDYLLKRSRSIEALRKCEFMLDELHLFGDNETVDEVFTSELRYFLNYALLGWLLSKVNSNKPEVRATALEEARDYYLKYLILTKNYELHNYNVKKLTASKENSELDKLIANVSRQAAFDENLVNMAYERSEKIKRFKEMKQIETQLEQMSLVLDTVKPELVDEETRRKTFNTFIKYWINKAVDDLKVIEDEINILKSIGEPAKESNRMHAGIANVDRQPVQTAKKPFIITKDVLQAKVFGMGYPSLPVYSIEEFYDHLADEGHMPKADNAGDGAIGGGGGVQIGGGVTQSQRDKEKAEKDLREDAHDEQELKKQREWDEFKDENKRGAGNTYNRS